MSAGDAPYFLLHGSVHAAVLSVPPAGVWLASHSFHAAFLCVCVCSLCPAAVCSDPGSLVLLIATKWSVKLQMSIDLNST